MRYSIFLLLFAAASLLAVRSDAQVIGPDQFMPDALTQTAVEQKLDSPVPLQLRFIDDQNKSVTLGDYFQGDMPVILSMNYSNCPMLCVLQLNGAVDALREIDLEAGKDFQLVSVSFDPEETVTQAKGTKQKYIASYEKPTNPEGWHFLTGSQESIAKLADALGINYTYLPEKKEYSHPAVFTVCTPDGKISRYHNGIEFPPQTIRLSLVEAGEGKIGTLFDQFVMICFHYDETEGRYAPTARNIMKIGGGMAIIALGFIIWTCHKIGKYRQAVSERAEAQNRNNSGGQLSVS